MAGLPAADVRMRYHNLELLMAGSGHQIIIPANSAELATAGAHGVLDGFGDNGIPEVTDKAIYERDLWWVRSCDVLFADLTVHAGKVSVGTMFEMAWAAQLGKHVIVAMEKDAQSPYHHPFIYGAAHVVFPTVEAAMGYIKSLR